ncbi:hypothetical protein LTR99_011055 [Exophiala xenobiotica]|uniref:Uncharacterized protein n=1 Tax=Vermiconidia calcicola TaxID=1690605 RepID=A0AAV9PUU2_9PEZI|nr:hypothetical protein LTR92_010996 [Exophiala xenobiotica]KAK5527624.1 hypothetical protein LTR25_011039 [Vermiconidia calcicola]KAK5528075.1 hypothetical protein LTR23_011135 [Chaetothyriales sp. CCFEE 6169]KAK5290568.1 hypothetical protein LTR99_011055 [Exophiala xenobiotica]KAK5313019.1 hypothetical protein LTR93_011086 [Exophiala xenobiotica]
MFFSETEEVDGRKTLSAEIAGSGFLSDVHSTLVKGKSVEYHGLCIKPGDVVLVRNDQDPDDWMAFVRDIRNRPRQRLHIEWLEVDQQVCLRGLRPTGIQQKIDVDTVNDIAYVGAHTGICVQQNMWCCDTLPIIAMATTSPMVKTRRTPKPSIKSRGRALMVRKAKRKLGKGLAKEQSSHTQPVGFSGHGSQGRSALAPISGNLARKTIEDDRFAKILAAVVEDRRFLNANAIEMGEAEGQLTKEAWRKSRI